jgi:hypothetical protein
MELVLKAHLSASGAGGQTFLGANAGREVPARKPGRRSADELAASQRRGYLCPRSFVHLPGRAHGVRNQSPSNTWWFENGCSSSGVARRLCLSYGPKGLCGY